MTEGETLVLGAGGVPVGDPSLYDRVRAGDPVFIADGTIDLVATEVGTDRLVCRVRVGGTIRVAQGDQPAARHVVPAGA